MKHTNDTILAIETSCDETAFSILQRHDDGRISVLSHKVHSQADLHAEFGGVFPAMAKREHDKNFTPLLASAFKEAFDIAIPETMTAEADQAENKSGSNINEQTTLTVESILSREDDLASDLIAYFQSISESDFAMIKERLTGIAVTHGPGLEPALWVGISGAKTLATIFDKPLFPINHMEGHIASVLASSAMSEHGGKVPDVSFPAIALLISGGHTELVSISSWHQYSLIGQTVDDAIGEAYDKVARLLGLPYPGGPHVSRLAETWRSAHPESDAKSHAKHQHGLTPSAEHNEFSLPRPMIHSKDYNFSFSGLKTACLYAVRDTIKAQDDQSLSQEQKEALAAEFEQAASDVLRSKTMRAIEEYAAQTLIIGGGVIANQFIRKNFAALCDESDISLLIPDKSLATDNATMIGLVAHLQIADGKTGFLPTSAEFSDVRAHGNLSL